MATNQSRVPAGVSTGGQFSSTAHSEASVTLQADEDGLPLLNGFSADQVEDHLERESHQNQCGCHLPGSVCYTYGERWRGMSGAPNVHAVFEAIRDMGQNEK